jgi:uncharacterized membrane protein
MTALIRTLLAGLLVLLPIAVTAILVAWVATFLYAYVGPQSGFGRVLTSIGFGFVDSSVVAYLVGIVVVLALIYLIGLVVESNLRSRVYDLIDRVMRRIPIVGNVYEVSKRFVAMVDKTGGDDLRSMSPVWCFFGGAGSAAVFALLPTPEPILIGEEPYHVVLIPSAPVPVGGCLVYVPAKWIVRADVGVDALMSTYVSMGVTHPKKPNLPIPAPPPAATDGNNSRVN